MSKTTTERRADPGDSLAPGAGPDDGIDLGSVVASLDSEVLTLIGGPLERPVPVSDVLIFDPDDLETIMPGTIVLAVGIALDGSDAKALLKHAAERGAAAVAFRASRTLTHHVEQLASSSGVAVLGVEPDVRWGHVYSLLRTAMVNRGEYPRPTEAGVAIGDLFALADAIAAAVGGPVTIEDTHYRVLAYSNLDFEIDQARRDTILGRTPPRAWQRRIEESGVGAALRAGEELLRFEGRAGEGFATRLVAPVRAGDELLGSIWVAEAGTTLGKAAGRELVRASKTAAVHLLSHRASEEIKRRTRGAFVREVLEGRAPSQSAIAVLPASGPFAVLVFAVGAESGAMPAAGPERVLSLISLHCESRHPQAMCARIEARFWSVLPALGSDDRAATRALARKILERAAASLGVQLCAAIGTTVAAIADVPRSRRAAEQALDVLMRRGGYDRVVHIDDVRAHAVLQEILDWASVNPELAHGKIEKLIDHDRDRRTDYCKTLRAYLDARGDIRIAAKQLSIHPNTLRHRLGRLVQLTGLDLKDPDERLVTELQLRMH